MCDAPIWTTSWSPAVKRNRSKRLTYLGAEGVTSHTVKKRKLIKQIIVSSNYWRTRHAGHCWRSKDEIVSDVLLWTPAYGQSKARLPARTFIQQLCDDTGCNPEDLPEAMNDRETWRESVWDIRASRTTWWWWLIEMICSVLYFQVFLSNTNNFLRSIWLSNVSITNTTSLGQNWAGKNVYYRVLHTSRSSRIRVSCNKFTGNDQKVYCSWRLE